MEASHGLTHIHTFSSLPHHSLCFCSFQSLASPHMLTPISQMRRMRPKQAKELVEGTQTVSSREGVKRGLHVSCLLPAPYMLFLPHTCSPLIPPPKLDFSHVFLVCVCSLMHVWRQGFLFRRNSWSGVRALSWGLKPTSVLSLALLRSLCGDLGPFIELL